MNFSNQSDGGKIKGNITVNIVKLIVGAERASINDFNAVMFIVSRNSRTSYKGPEIPPSFLILQKWTAMKIIATNGIAIQ